VFFFSVKLHHNSRIIDAAPLVIQSMAACRKGTNNKYEFKFDRVFSPTSSQAEVFEEISQLVQVTVTDAHFAVVS